MSKEVVKITKGLASVATEARENALVEVQLWLENTNFETMDTQKLEIDLLRIWQGIFYSFWLTDGLEKQYAVSVIISEMIQLFKDNTDACIIFMKTFYQTLIDTWPKLDKHRVAKYMSLIRRFMQQSFVYLNSHEFEPALFDKFMKMISQGPMDVNRRLIGSLQCHITRCFYPTMKEFGYEHMNEQVFLRIIDLFLTFYAETFDTAVMRTIESEIFDAMLHEGDAQYEAEKMQERMHEQDDSGSDVQVPLNEDDLVIFPINYKYLSDKMERLSTQKSTENKDECFQWKNKFYDRHIQSVEDPMVILDDLEQELEQIKLNAPKKANQAPTETSTSGKKANKKKKKNKKNKKQQEEQQKTQPTTTITEAPKPVEAPTKKEEPVSSAPSPKTQTPEKKGKKNKKQTTPNAAQQSTTTKQSAPSTPPSNKTEAMEVESPITPEPITPLVSRSARKSGRRNRTVEKQATTESTDAEDTPSKRVLFSLKHNRTKTFEKQDVVSSSPLPNTNPTKGLLKRKLFEDETDGNAASSGQDDSNTTNGNQVTEQTKTSVVEPAKKKRRMSIKDKVKGMKANKTPPKTK